MHVAKSMAPKGANYYHKFHDLVYEVTVPLKGESWLKLDLTKVYEQICIEPKDVPKTAFSTIVGTFVSNVLQMGDMNSTSTCQCLMVYIF
jgi:hypothetical protein